MDDSNILYYLVLGAIYLISRAFRKKKPQNKPTQKDGSVNRPQPNTRVEQQQTQPQSSNRPTSVEDILKELTKEFEPERTVVEERTIEPEEVKPVEPAYQPKPQPDYQEYNIEGVGPDEEIDIVPHRQIQRDKPVYQRVDKFKINDRENEAVSEVYDLLAEEHGPRKALIMKEIFDRKY